MGGGRIEMLINRDFFLKIYSGKARIQDKVPGKSILCRDIKLKCDFPERDKTCQEDKNRGQLERSESKALKKPRFC